jgi:hypothetical protein
MDEQEAPVRGMPDLRSDLTIVKHSGEGATCVISDPVTGRYSRCGENEHSLLQLLKAPKDCAEVIRKFKAETGLEISRAQLDRFLETLSRSGFVTGEQASERAPRGQNLLFVRLKSFSVQPLLDRITIPHAQDPCRFAQVFTQARAGADRWGLKQKDGKDE